jgi:hypothetical protein
VPSLVALWGAPRTVSTAFERMMRERGDHEVLFEPFAAHYYFSADRRSPRYDGLVEPSPEHDFDAILARLRDLATRRPVFIKDMAYHVAARVCPELLAAFTHTFIVRHPRLSLPSLARLWPDFTAEEAGFAALRQLFDRVVEDSGRVPPVIDGEDLRTDPERVVAAWCAAVGLEHRPDALTWRPGHADDDWRTWRPWVESVARSDGLVADAGSHPPDALEDARLEEAARGCLDDYEHLARHRL